MYLRYIAYTVYTIIFYTHTHMSVYRCTRTFKHLYTHYTYIFYMYIHSHTHTHIHLYTPKYNIFISMYTICTYIYIHSYTYTHTHTHTHTHICYWTIVRQVHLSFSAIFTSSPMCSRLEHTQVKLIMGEHEPKDLLLALLKSIRL